MWIENLKKRGIGFAPFGFQFADHFRSSNCAPTRLQKLSQIGLKLGHNLSNTRVRIVAMHQCGLGLWFGMWLRKRQSESGTSIKKINCKKSIRGAPYSPDGSRIDCNSPRCTHRAPAVHGSRNCSTLRGLAEFDRVLKNARETP